jgi:hypothetical protein
MENYDSTFFLDAQEANPAFKLPTFEDFIAEIRDWYIELTLATTWMKHIKYGRV